MAYQLHVRIIEADDIPKMDVNSSDPYCILRYENQSQKTSVIKNTKHPSWNQDFHFNVTDPKAGEILIQMKDKDLKNDDDMATLSFPLEKLPVGQVIDGWYDMVPAKKVKKGGRLHLTLNLGLNGIAPFTNSVPPGGFPPGPPPGAYPPQGYPPQGYPQQGYPPR